MIFTWQCGPSDRGSDVSNLAAGPIRHGIMITRLGCHDTSELLLLPGQDDSVSFMALRKVRVTSQLRLDSDSELGVSHRRPGGQDHHAMMMIIIIRVNVLLKSESVGLRAGSLSFNPLGPAPDVPP
jgi:hypothetical protein